MGTCCGLRHAREGTEAVVGAGGASFDVPSGFLAGSYDGVLIFTDLEADDAVAIKVLAPALRSVPLMCVVGEADVDKRSLCTGMLRSYGLRGAVLQGLKSKESYPLAALTAYDSPKGKSGGEGQEDSSPGGEDECVSLAAAFLSKFTSPIALILKPPHELLGVPDDILARTSAAMYGSFNLECFRKSLVKMEPGADPHARQASLIRSFKAMLWIERSAAVGRDCVLAASQATPESSHLWAAIHADEPLMRLMQAWNTAIMRSHAEKVRLMAVEVAEKAASADQNDAEFPFSELAPSAERAEKRMAVIKSILGNSGLQICHADTLLAAALLDGDGLLEKYTRRVSCECDKSGKPTFKLEEGSHVAALVSQADSEGRAELIAASFNVLMPSSALAEVYGA
uniref:Uncharacterized protein n=1 Tax=Coccolithus braarudii TaxID=221442 RepID=A0A7S0LH34_9EUKA|mmetsp:Transcript_3701/g.7937  ORF Transcript_3701/g.7937 Transcript_3701/m.7937 type:complete len:398 (+) Transcript_3701:14-1207(+)